MNLLSALAAGLALVSLVVFVLQLSGRWPVAVRSGPLEWGVAVGALAGAWVAFGACLGAISLEAGVIGSGAALFVLGLYLGARWQEARAITRWRWPWQRHQQPSR
jgi:hypothetical protein